MGDEKPKDHLGKVDTWLSLGQWAVKAVIAVSAVGIPAWAAKAANILSDYAPFSWVAIGIASAGVLAGAYALWGWGRQRHRRATYDKLMMQRGAYVDPLEKTFERRRIFLNEFCLPSHPLIEGKTFIDCQIIGPANIILVSGNSVNDHQYPICDAMVLAPETYPNNGYAFTNCMFRGCSFQRVTLMFSVEEFERAARDISWLRWITLRPSGQAALPFDNEHGEAAQLSSGSGDEPD